MANGFKTGGKNFEKGHKVHSKTPMVKGHSLAMTAEEKMIRRLSVKQILAMVEKYFAFNLQQAQLVLEDPNTPMLDGCFLQIMINARLNGDYNGLEFILKRTIGPVKEKIEVSVPKPTVIKLIGQDAVVAIGAMKDEDEE